MSTLLKVMIGLLLTVPVGAYVTGTLVASQADMPSERSPIVISDEPTDLPSPSNSPSASASPTEPPSATKAPKPTNQATGRGGDDDNGGRGSDDDDDSNVVRPSPRDIEDGWDDDDRDDTDDGGDSDDGNGDDDG